MMIKDFAVLAITSVVCVILFVIARRIIRSKPNRGKEGYYFTRFTKTGILWSAAMVVLLVLGYGSELFFPQTGVAEYLSTDKGRRFYVIGVVIVATLTGTGLELGPK